MKKKMLSLALMTIFISLMALGSAAYFTVEGRATNIITTGTVDMELREMQLVGGEEIPYPTETITGVMPGRSVSKIPYIVGAEGTQPFYTRVKVDVTVTVNGQPDEAGLQYVAPNYDTENWEQDVEGWWYYKGEVKADEKVALFTEVAFAPEMPNEYQNCTVTVSISAQATQVKNNPVPEAGYTAIVGWPAEIAQ